MATSIRSRITSVRVRVSWLFSRQGTKRVENDLNPLNDYVYMWAVGPSGPSVLMPVVLSFVSMDDDTTLMQTSSFHSHVLLKIYTFSLAEINKQTHGLYQVIFFF